MLELELALENSKLDILGICEVKRAGENMIKTIKGNLFCHYGSLGQRGVGFLINKAWGEKLIMFKGISDRIAVAKFDLRRGKTLSLVQVYAPTAVASENELENFYRDLSESVNSLANNSKHQMLIKDPLPNIHT